MQILKTIVDHGPMPVVEFRRQGGEEIQVRPHARSASDDDETLIEVAKVMMCCRLRSANRRRWHAGSAEQKPGRKVPAGERPGGYLPVNDDPYRDRDGVSETLPDPDKRSLSDALATRDTTEEG